MSFDNITNMQNMTAYITANQTNINTLFKIVKQFLPEYANIEPVKQPHPLLFQQNKYSTSQQSRVVDSNIGKDLLHNHTRTQLRNM